MITKKVLWQNLHEYCDALEVNFKCMYKVWIDLMHRLAANVLYLDSCVHVIDLYCSCNLVDN